VIHVLSVHIIVTGNMILENHFDRGKMFYPFVVNYITTLHGIIDLMSRGIVNDINKQIDVTEDQRKALVNLYGGSINKFLENPYLTPQIGPLSLKTLNNDDSINIVIDELGADYLENYKYLLPLQLKAAGSLIVMTYELTAQQYDDKSSIWNFFCHCRLAAAHGGSFPSLNKKRFPAKWRTMEITMDNVGSPLFNTPETGGLLGIGDPISLLWDIEQKYLEKLPVTKDK
jgi:hypothetical protein